MIHFTIRAVFIAIFAVCTVPTATHALTSTEQHAIRLDSTTVLYTVTYRFNVLNRAVRMPIGAGEDIDRESTDDVGYIFVRGDDTPFTNGVSHALVLSSAEIRDGAYYVPQGKEQFFTLVALLKVPEEVGGDTQSTPVGLKVISLPFSLVDTYREDQGYLTSEQLKSYITPKILLPTPTNK